MTNLENKIIEHFTNNPGVNPKFSSLGTTYKEANPVIDKLFAEGKLVWKKVPSKSGKTMQNKIFAA